ncbi:MAG: YbaB/EbfC family nucleoid-associated protein [bacterium]|nr:YbaB/EbfC family nucleoid-associated protein [bacterium]
MGLFDKIKDINEMRKQAKQIELMLANEEVVGKSPGEKIKITVDGNQKVKSVEVSDSIVGDRGEIARNIREAIEDLNSKHKKMLQSKFGSMMG